MSVVSPSLVSETALSVSFHICVIAMKIESAPKGGSFSRWESGEMAEVESTMLSRNSIDQNLFNNSTYHRSSRHTKMMKTNDQSLVDDLISRRLLSNSSAADVLSCAAASFNACARLASISAIASQMGFSDLEASFSRLTKSSNSCCRSLRFCNDRLWRSGL